MTGEGAAALGQMADIPKSDTVRLTYCKAGLEIALRVVRRGVQDVGCVATAPFMGAVLGNTLGGWLSDRVFQKRRIPTMMLSIVATVVMMYALVYAPNDPAALSAIFLPTGLFLSFGFCAFGIYPSTMTTKKAFPVAATLINTGGKVGSAVLPLTVGIIPDRADWNAVVLFLSCCSLAGFVLLLTIIEPLTPGKPIMTAAT